VSVDVDHHAAGVQPRGFWPVVSHLIAPYDSSMTTNRLIDETSPYLRQHAHNPVDWQPWDDAALNEARSLDRPIFLSIGYSACHWCHVMEHESFENADIAALMNQRFVNIKVDREERPDLDQIYMNAVMALTGSGGWPMSVFLTPDLRPFFGGTYWPPTEKWGRPGFCEILTAVHEAWTNRRNVVLNQAGELTDAVVQACQPTAGAATLNDDVLRNAMRSLLGAADMRHGGFGGAPKFPHPMDLRVLLRCWKRFQNQEALDVVNLTLDKMARGGIYDHLGGGFARYSTDEKWLVPHFEKMLYDNALLVPAYLEAYQATGNADYARVARETLDYVLREMTQPQGGFYSTQDADSEGVEGKFFVWTEEEVLSALAANPSTPAASEQPGCLSPDDAKTFAYCYDVTAQGNWEHRNILNRPKTQAQAAQLLKRDAAELEKMLSRCRERLFDVRSQRVPPGRDDKVLVSWNGLMIAAMAQAANVLNEPRYAEAARSATEFILSSMRTDDGRLWHAFKDGRARFNAYLDDYAALIDGLVELSQVPEAEGLQPLGFRYVAAAVELAERMLDQFWDDEHGGFFFTAADHETLIARNKDTHDNATPSGNSLAATALIKLGRLTGRQDFEDRARETLEAMSGTLARIPMAAGQALIALDFALGPTHEVVLCDGASKADSDAAWNALHARFVPNKLAVRIEPGRVALASSDERDRADTPRLLEGKTAISGDVTAYVCDHGACQAPVHGFTAVAAAWTQLK
jgi:uncharacterized protein YyaL (SSP411 family)